MTPLPEPKKNKVNQQARVLNFEKGVKSHGQKSSQGAAGALHSSNWCKQVRYSQLTEPAPLPAGLCLRKRRSFELIMLSAAVLAFRYAVASPMNSSPRTTTMTP